MNLLNGMTLPVLGCVATLTGFAGLAQAQTNDSAEGFLAALSSIPLATVVDGTTWLELEYGDPAAALPVASLGAIQGLRHHDDPARLAASRGTQQAWAQVFLATDPAAMRAAIGLGPADFGRNLALRLGRAQMAMVVFQPEAAPALQAAIAAGGYQTDTRQGHPVWWRGDEDRATDPDARDPANPFGGNLGLASRFFIADSHLYWTSEWPMLDRVLSGGDGLNSHPALAALGAALQAEGQGALVYAYAILWPSAEEGAPDLTDLLTFGRSEGGLLAAAMVADLVAGTRETGLLALALSPGTDAEAIATRIARNWTLADDPVRGYPFAEAFPGAFQVRANAGPNPVVVVSLADDWGSDGAFRNQPAQVFQGLLMSGGIAALLAE